MTDESRAAREYAYGRWPEEFCSIAGIGYAPKDGNTFMEYCRAKGLNEESLLSLECSSATRMEAYMPCSGNAS